MTRLTSAVFFCLLLASSISEAQTIPGCNSLQFRIEQIDESHIRLTGEVEIECEEAKYYADEVDLYTDTNTLIANGNVVFTSGRSRIAADHVEFNTQTRTGTFHQAFGTSFLGDQVDRSMFGNSEPEAYFWGVTLEKLSETKYRITNGGFTTCVQPTPRWEVSASTFTLNLDDYAILKNAVLKVKGVPVFYMPTFYLPIQEDDRATGFLIPSFGTSTFKGSALSNAFFWAVNRSHDVTLLHDWFSEVGQGAGTEYRYVLGQRSQGEARAYFLDEHDPVRRSYQLRGSAMQSLGQSLVARAQVRYFSDMDVQQLFNNSIRERSRRDRTFGGNITGTWGSSTLTGSVDWRETFFGGDKSTLNGGAPRVSFRRAERPIGNLPIYFSFGSGYSNLLRQRRDDGVTKGDSGLTRLDVNPVARVPFTSWPFLTINSTLGLKATYWTERKDEETKEQVVGGITRRYFDLETRITGPSFVRIFDTSGTGYAERLKHAIEPWVALQRITAVDNFDQIVRLESTDSVVGTTRIGYGLNNRLYARRGASAREILNIAITQSYYSNARAAQFDRRFRTSFNKTNPSHFSPAALLVRATPTNRISGMLRAEYDTQFMALRTIGLDATVSAGEGLRASGGWSQRRFIEGLRGFDNPNRLDHYVNGSANWRTSGNKVGARYNFNYDIRRGKFLQQRILAYYNAQCCGLIVEYQTFDFRRLGKRARAPRDNRFNISFTLAGIGTFSNFLGAFGGGFGDGANNY